MDKILLSIVIVNYNSGNILTECINSIDEKDFGFEYEIIVVDNASQDDSMSFKCKYGNKIYLKENIGFVKGNNLGVDAAKGKYIYILNPDTVLLDNNIAELLEYLHTNPKAGIIAPKVYNSDMTLQLTCRREPTFRRLFMYLFGITKIFKKNKYVVDYKMELENFDNILYPDWVSGCSFIIKKKLFNELGQFDEDLFMYWEDVSICKEVRNKGYQIVFNPAHSIVHYGGISSSSVRLFSGFMDIKSRFIYFEKYHSKTYLFSIKLLAYTNILFKGIYETLLFRMENGIVYFKLLYKIIRL